MEQEKVLGSERKNPICEDTESEAEPFRRLPHYDYPRRLVCNCRPKREKSDIPNITDVMCNGPLPTEPRQNESRQTEPKHSHVDVTFKRQHRPKSLYCSGVQAAKPTESPQRCRSLKFKKDAASHDMATNDENVPSSHEKKRGIKEEILRALNLYADTPCQDIPCTRPVCKMMDLLEHHTPNYKRACLIYLEGCHGVGKTTLVNRLASSFPEKQLLTFLEPLGFWSMVYEDSLKKIYKATRQHKPYKKKYDASNEVLSCQTKFSVALRTIARSVQECMQPCAPLQQVTSADAMVIFDRHLISSTVIYPLVQMKKGIMSPCDMLGMFSGFRANTFDVIVLIILDADETLRRIRKRGRSCEDGVDRQCIIDVSSAYHTVYCTWLFVRYCPIELCMKLCLELITMNECAMECGLVNAGILQELFDKSLLKYFKDTIKMYKTSTCLFETFKQFCEELKKPYLLTFDHNKTKSSSPEHLTLYNQLLNTVAIKTIYLDWTRLSKLSHGYASENSFI